MERITRVKCIIPFILFMVNSRGYCYSCCSTWSKLGNVGKLTKDSSIMDVWNGERMQYLRKAILDDSLERVCNFQYCPYAIKNEYMNLETMKKAHDENFNHTIDQIMAGRTVIDRPPHTLQIASSGRCNLKCVMCETNDKCQKTDDLFDERLFSEILPEILPDVSELYLTLNGEVLFNPLSRKFLQTMDPTRYPSLRINLYTNGTLYTPKLWETIRQNRYDSIFISIDAASKETYEKIRKNGNWEILRRNLEFISELRRQNQFYHLCLNFCVMKSNYKEIKDFVEFGLKLGCDRMVFQKIVGFADVRENINFTHDKRVFAEIAQILSDPIFGRPEVETTVIDGYRKYLGKPGSIGWRLLTKSIEWVCYYPVKMIFSMAKYFSQVVDVYLFFQKKKIPAPKIRRRGLANLNKS